MRATYRLQLREGKDLDSARRLVPYLAQLGVSHLYLSPIFSARRGSTHGYDVTDPTRVDPVLGGEAALGRLAAALRRRGMGLLLDIVPNHQAADPQNPHFADVLCRGRESAFAPWFDVDWSASGGRIVLPLLAGDPRSLLAGGELALVRERGEPRLRVHGRSLPLAPASHARARALSRAARPDPEALLELLERQPFRLVPWRTGRHARNYRRFFDVDDLIAVRCEDRAVFDATHAAVLDWVERGWVDALRVDHVDGLADPAVYLRRLRRSLDARRPGRRIPIYVEKILALGERLPRGWPVAGTTGYEAAAALEAACVAPRAARRLRAFWRSFSGARASFEAVARASKREALESLFSAECERLAGALQGALRESGPATPPSRRTLGAALREAIAALDVYRTYPSAAGHQQRAERARWRTALERARGARPEALDLLGRIVLGPPRGPAGAEFLRQLQLLSAPAAAKGVEDTALYRCFAVPSLCEVGGDPAGPCGDARAELHRANAQRLREWPDSLFAVTTHDTKRSADVRARLAALGACDEGWLRGVRRWHRAASPWRTRVRRRAAPEAAFELALYEALLGLWPALAPGVVPPARQLAELRERLLAFARKAAREARLHTGWIDPDASYEAAIARFVTHLLQDRGGVLSDFSRASAPLIVQAGALALARRVVQLASPGVPDIYQGDELGLRALVDPDNRRPVDFARVRRRLAELERLLRGSSSQRAARLAELADGAPDERLTLWVTQAALAARRRMPALFARGDYVPLQLSGAGGATWLAFARRRGPAVALVAARIRVVPDGLRPRALLRLPAWLARASLRCALTGRRLQLASRELAVERVASGPIGLWLGRVGGPEK